jgi:hypothetical protein
MTELRERWRQRIALVSLKVFGRAIEFAVMPEPVTGSDIVLVVATALVPDRDTGEVMPIVTYEAPPPWMTDGDAIEWLRDLARKLLTHEIDECFRVAGVRIFDPHLKPLDGAQRDQLVKTAMGEG